MQEIRCPHCGEVYQVDEAGYAAIAQQVRDAEFNKEVARREQAAVQLALAQAAREKEQLKAQRRWRSSRPGSRRKAISGS